MRNINVLKTRKTRKTVQLPKIRKSSKDVFEGCRLEENDRLWRLQPWLRHDEREWGWWWLPCCGRGEARAGERRGRRRARRTGWIVNIMVAAGWLMDRVRNLPTSLWLSPGPAQAGLHPHLLQSISRNLNITKYSHLTPHTSHLTPHTSHLPAACKLTSYSTLP